MSLSVCLFSLVMLLLVLVDLNNLAHGCGWREGRVFGSECQRGQCIRMGKTGEVGPSLVVRAETGRVTKTSHEVAVWEIKSLDWKQRCIEPSRPAHHELLSPMRSHIPKASMLPKQHCQPGPSVQMQKPMGIFTVKLRP